LGVDLYWAHNVTKALCDIFQLQGLAVRRYLNNQRHVFLGLFCGLLIIALSVFPLLAQEMTAEEKLKLSDDLSIKAVKMAAMAREFCNCELLEEALESANRAAVLLSEVAAQAENTGNVDLAQSAYNTATNVVGAAVGLIIETCAYCGRTSLNLETVACSGEKRARAEEISRFNDETIQTTLAAGAMSGLPEAYDEPEAPSVEPPVEDELPIRDHEQPTASPA
jgi:hypothetical protein